MRAKASERVKRTVLKKSTIATRIGTARLPGDESEKLNPGRAEWDE